MKKIIAICLFVFMFNINVKALNNTLSFTEDGKSLYYDTDKLDKESLLTYRDLVPGKTFEDKIIISNASNHTCKLYLKVVEKEQSALAGDLLKSINMQIYIDEELIYDGNALGLPSNELGVNLQDSVYIGEYPSKKKNTMIVKTELDKTYTNHKNNEESYIEWEFYGQCGENDIVVINPDTGNSISPVVFYLLTIVVIISLLLCIHSTKKYKKLKKSFH